MPTKHQRIPVTNDDELAEALARVGSLYPGAATARLVHDLAVKGADAALREDEERGAAIDRLVAFSSDPSSLTDVETLERVDELAWGE
jgi:hypothetical protein